MNMFYGRNVFRFVSLDTNGSMRYAFDPWGTSTLGLVGKHFHRLSKIEIVSCSLGRLYRLTLSGCLLKNSTLEIMRAGGGECKGCIVGCFVNSSNLVRGQEYLQMTAQSAGPSTQLTGLRLGMLIHLLEFGGD